MADDRLTPGETLILRRLLVRFRRQVEEDTRAGHADTKAKVINALNTTEKSLRLRTATARRQMAREFLYGQ